MGVFVLALGKQGWASVKAQLLGRKGVPDKKNSDAQLQALWASVGEPPPTIARGGGQYASWGKTRDEETSPLVSRLPTARSY